MATSILPASFDRDIDYFIENKLDTANDVLIVAAQAKLLSKVVKLSFEDATSAANMIQSKLPLNLCHPAIAYLRAAVLEQIVGRIVTASISEWTEFDVHRHFWDRLESYVPGAIRTIRPVDRKHIPDGWIQLDGECLPVEIKKGTFSRSAVRQIRRYMDFYDARRAIAVAQDFPVETGEGIICVRFDVDSVTNGSET